MKNPILFLVIIFSIYLSSSQTNGYQLAAVEALVVANSEPAMQILQNLSNEQVDFYVSGDYAKYKHPGIKDFLPFIDVSPGGTAQLQDYINLGFSHIELEQTNAVD